MNVFDFALNVERRCLDYYADLSRLTDNLGVRKIFHMLMRDEERLIGKLEELRTATADADRLASTVLDEMIGRLDVLFDRDRDIALGSDLAAYNHAMLVEGEICRIYQEAATRETDARIVVLLQKIAAEETRELESIRRTYEFVNAPNVYLAWGEFSNLQEFHNFGRDEG